ncbi:MAG: M50 family metallopeptidase [Clostridia bacterium]
METFLSIIAAFLVLTVFVLVHELGHFGMGRILGFEILEFAIGMGPIVAKKEKNGIIYAIRALPIGGMCRFYGEDEETRDAVGFNDQKLWKRALVVAAGPVMNIVFAVLFAAITLMAYGDYVPAVESFSGENTPAQAAGILPGDLLISVDGREISYFNEATQIIGEANSERSSVVVERDGKRIELVIEDFYNADEGCNMMGVMIGAQRKLYGFFEAFGHSFAYVWSIIVEMLSFLGGIFTRGVQSGDVVGPVGTISLIGQAVRMGFEMVLRLGVLISVNLAIINLLPLPALDGGRLVFMGIEAVRGKPVPPKVEGAVHFVGIVLLLGLIFFLSVKDVIGLFGG